MNKRIQIFTKIIFVLYFFSISKFKFNKSKRERESFNHSLSNKRYLLTINYGQKCPRSNIIIKKKRTVVDNHFKLLIIKLKN